MIEKCDPTEIEVRDDIVLPFYLEESAVSGKAIKLGATANEILNLHNYPAPVSSLLAEAMALTAMLGSAIKFDGRLIFQTQSDGPVSMLVVDYATPGTMRAYAGFDEKKLMSLSDEESENHGLLLGKGHMALTLDQGQDTERHQGIVALDSDSLEEAAKHYFEQSEQMETFVHLSAGQNQTAGQNNESEWRIGGLLIQRVAAEGGKPLKHDKQDVDYTQPDAGETEEEDWNRVRILAETTEAHELLDPTLALEQLLYRLFHEENIRTYEAHPIAAKCKCSRERTLSILKNFMRSELKQMITDDGKIEMTCEFCSRQYVFDPAETGKKI